ncbi:MAG TPA: hypothetical protein DCE03_03170 [Synergistaceae bacterium]|nr:hypothetical protein [Synergistaceae bacterium]HAG22321.1 hypothetical protein [Synergistaceae bacterium]
MGRRGPLISPGKNCGRTRAPGLGETSQLTRSGIIDFSADVPGAAGISPKESRFSKSGSDPRHKRAAISPSRHERSAETASCAE